MTTKPANGGAVVIGRKRGRAVRIGRGITVTVTKIEGDAVDLMIEAPHDVAISRDDASLEAHLENCRARERGEAITLREATRRAQASRQVPR